jgi:hypothetical protein
MVTNGGWASDIELSSSFESDSGMIRCKHVFHRISLRTSGNTLPLGFGGSYISEGKGEPIWTVHGSGETSLSWRVSAFIKGDKVKLRDRQDL